MKNIQSLSEFINESNEILSESVYLDKNGQIPSYNMGYVEIGRKPS